MTSETAPHVGPPLAIPGWPFVARGLLMATVSNVVFIHLDERLSESGYASYLRELEASLAHRQLNTRVAVVYDIPSFSSLWAMAAPAGGHILKRYARTLADTTACFALVSPSAVARAAAQTALAVSRLPFPQRTCQSLGVALAFVASHVPNVDAWQVERRIGAALADNRLAMRG